MGLETNCHPRAQAEDRHRELSCSALARWEVWRPMAGLRGNERTDSALSGSLGAT